MRQCDSDLPKIKLRLQDLLTYLAQQEIDNPIATTGSPAAGSIGKSQEGKKRRGRPGIPDELKIEALRAKKQGASNRDCARILYAKQYPEPQQVKNVSSIRRRSGKMTRQRLLEVTHLKNRISV